VASNFTDLSVNSIEILHHGNENRTFLWEKIRAILCYTYENFYSKYDWFMIADDNTFVIMENLRRYLESEEIRTAANGGIFLPSAFALWNYPLLLGRRFAFNGDKSDIYPSGGPGYLLNQAALKTMVVYSLPHRLPKSRLRPNDDMMVARVLGQMGVYPYETKDAHGSERFMPFHPDSHYKYRKQTNKNWYDQYTIDAKEGLDHCSKYSISFHNIKLQDTLKMHALLYGCCPLHEYTKQAFDSPVCLHSNHTLQNED
jgi:glycoprotein-N-acetylgalactosamine 3-beta-galactosyltransferase